MMEIYQISVFYWYILAVCIINYIRFHSSFISLLTFERLIKACQFSLFWKAEEMAAVVFPLRFWMTFLSTARRETECEWSQDVAEASVALRRSIALAWAHVCVVSYCRSFSALSMSNYSVIPADHAHCGSHFADLFSLEMYMR